MVNTYLIDQYQFQYLLIYSLTQVNEWRWIEHLESLQPATSSVKDADELLFIQ